MTKPITIIIPTYNNEEYLNPCVVSILQAGVLNDLADLVIVNNGKQDIERHFGGHPGIKIVSPESNLGWEGGLKYGMGFTESPFLVFQNDDTLVPPLCWGAYSRMLAIFGHDAIAAVGPSTTCAASVQSIFHPQTPRAITEVSYLIFFCVMVRRAYLDAVGGIDTSLPGGDDFDLSIRFRKAGYKLLVDPFSFIYHHGFKTGTRVRGDHTMDGGWNSTQMIDRTNRALIQKHGFKTWFQTIRGLDYSRYNPDSRDLEGDLVRSHISNESNVLELGCGGRKTVPNAVGIDRAKKGEPVPNVPGMISVADVVADIQGELPFARESQDAVIARHILEHCVDSVGTIKNWRNVLKTGGKLIVAVPDEHILQGIPLNPEHAHAFSQESLRNLVEACGFKQIDSRSSDNGVSFVGCFERLN